MEKFNAWTQQINEDYAANALPQFEQYITDYTRYAPNQGDTWTAYHLKSLTLSDTDFNIDENSYVNLALHYSQGTDETTTVGKLWSGKMEHVNASIDFPKLNKIVIVPTEGATLIISLIKSIKDEETQLMNVEETFLGVVPLPLSPDGTSGERPGREDEDTPGIRGQHLHPTGRHPLGHGPHGGLL